MWYWVFKYVLLGPFLKVWGRPKVTGLENIPEEGAVILASNHLAVFDSMLLPLVVPRRITFLAKSEYFTGTGLKGAFERWFYTAAGQVPIDRTNKDSAQAALDTAAKIVSEGKLLGMYPEGTRSPDGRLFRGKTGVVRLAAKTHTSIVPVAMINTNKFNPPGTIMLRPHKVGIVIGEPISFDDATEEQADSHIFLRERTNQLMARLAELSGQEYVDVYAADVKNGSIKLDELNI